MMNQFYSGNFEQAAKIASSKSESRSGTGDELMWRLEEGTALFTAGDYDASIKAYEKCEEIIKDFENRANVNIREGSTEAASLATNQNALSYQGSYVEKILLNTYKALAYFAKGDAEGARVELRRAYERQKETRKEFEAEIAEADKEAKDKNINAAKIIAGSKGLQDFEKVLIAHSNKSYGDFVNPFTTYLSAIGYLSDGDKNGALVDLRNLYKMDSGIKTVQQDLVTCAKAIGMDVPTELKGVLPLSYSLSNNIVYVIFEEGKRPVKKAFSIHLPLPPPVGYTGVAFPILEYDKSPPRTLTVSDSRNNIYITEPVAYMNSIISKQYRKALPAMIIRLVISVAAKEAANIAVVETARKKGGDLAGLLAMLGMGLYKYTFNTADTRCWEMLPRTYQVTHFKRPDDMIIKVHSGSSGSEMSVKCNNEKKISILYVKSPIDGVFSVKLFEFD